MATSKDCLARASRELGYCRWDDPQAGTKYGRWYAELTKSPYFGTSGIPFCAMGVSYIMDAVEQACAGLPTAGVPTIYSGASRAGIIIPNKRSAVPGDIVIFDWSNVYGPNDHVGFVEINRGGTGLQTIEFNTTGADGRSGSVARKVRGWDVVQCIVRPPWSKGETGGVEDYLPTALAVDGMWGEATTISAQVQAGTPVDGIVSSQDASWKRYYKGCTSGWEWLQKAEGSQLIIAIQKTLRDKYGQDVGEIDGVAGRLFWRALERAAGYDADEVGLEYPSNTIRWLQRQLNAGTFF